MSRKVMTEKQRMARLVELFNELAEIEPAIYQRCRHDVVGAGHSKALVKVEAVCPELGLSNPKPGAGLRVTVPALLATVTDILCGKRLCFNLANDGSTQGFGWWKKPNAGKDASG